MSSSADPLDVGILEKSVNESAASVSALWVTYLLFGLYLALTAGSVTHRQLLLVTPIKLPVLNVDLPMTGFFLLSPILFVILHLYVLMQAAILSRTAATYNEALEKNIHFRSDREKLRLRLSNNLFAQIFAGALRKGESLVGWLFRQIAWITLAAAPLLVIAIFQYKFLPYHSRSITWTHRGLALLEGLSIIVFWVDLLNNSHRSAARAKLSAIAILGFGLCTILIVFGILLSFPGEPQARVGRHSLAERRPGIEECRTVSWIESLFEKDFDRISVSAEIIIDRSKLKELETLSSNSGLPAFLGERTVDFSNRDFRCANFDSADLRRADFRYTDLSGSSFISSKIEGATFDRATLDRSDFTSSEANNTSFGLAHLPFTRFTRSQLNGTNYQGALLEHAEFGGASVKKSDFSASILRDSIFLNADISAARFVNAQLQGSYFQNANSRATNFSGAWLQGASFAVTDLRGSIMRDVNAQGTNFLLTDLQGADFRQAKLQGASFVRALLQATSFRGSDLHGTVFSQAQLQLADFKYSSVELTYLSQSLFWRTDIIRCEGAATRDAQWDEIFAIKFPPFGRGERILATPDAIDGYIKELRDTMPESTSDSYEKVFRQRLATNPPIDNREIWNACSLNLQNDVSLFEAKMSRYLSSLTCDNAVELRPYIARGILKTWTSEFLSSSHVTREVARSFNDPDKISCPRPGP
ncbi:pentapeptide repeat-containing protein [Bradyrhizobium oligotrophicum]|uniref:pentapeptide repeat-containing protein n=1 Tax=Bradyrhizobium oligotrophicum TaxID=44255 RepID=UPI003EBCBFF5